jgi:hypothetical protein
MTIEGSAGTIARPDRDQPKLAITRWICTSRPVETPSRIPGPHLSCGDVFCDNGAGSDERIWTDRDAG